MSFSRFQFPFTQAFEAATGDVGSGWKLYFYATGSTSTLQATYSDSALTTPNTNPVVASSAGRWGDIFLSNNEYNVVLKDENDVTIASADKVGPLTSTGLVDAVFATVATMVAATGLTVGMSVRTLGYYAIGDGGGNDYSVVAAGTGTANAGRYINLATHQALGLFCDNVWTPKRYGAYTNNTNAATTTNAFLKWYADLITNSDARADGIIGTGNFALNANLPWTGRAGVFGAQNTEECALIPSGTFTAVTIDNGGNTSIGGFYINGAALTGVGLLIDNFSLGSLHDVNVTGCSSHGIHFRGGNISEFRRIDSVNNGGDGFKVDSFGSAANISCNANQFVHVNCRNNTLAGLKFTEGDANHGFVVCEQNDDGGLVFDLAIGNSFFAYLEANKFDSGTTTSTSAGKLVDSTQNFLTTCTAGQRVVNTTDNKWTTISAVDSNTQLALTDDIMTSGDAYVVSNGELQLTNQSIRNFVTVLAIGHKHLVVDAGTNNGVMDLAGNVAFAPVGTIRPLQPSSAAVGRSISLTGGQSRGNNRGGAANLSGGDGDTTGPTAGGAGGHLVLAGGQPGTGSTEYGQVQIQNSSGDTLIGNATDKIYHQGVLIENQTSESLTTGGAISIVKQTTRLTANASPTNFTLADGTEGQIKDIVCISGAAGACRVTPANLYGATYVNLPSSGEGCRLKFTAGEWWVLGCGPNVTVA
jgi:hypothetical protein